MKNFCVGFIAGTLFLTGSASGLHSQDGFSPTPAAAGHTGAHDFDFLVGEWRVHHHRLKPNSQYWVDFEGTFGNRKLMDGGANLEEYNTDGPSGAHRAVALRSYDPKTSQWSIWWLDERTPHSELDPPVQGRFEKGVGIFYGHTTTNGKPMRVRFVWSQITGTSARWDQAYSPDAGKTWETNWTMEFQRAL
jgi:hypothetical protein